MPRVHYVKSARVAHGDIKVGEPYYWWKFRYGGKRTSKTPPKQSQLTQSDYLQRIYSLEEQDQPDFDMLGDALDNTKSELESLRDEQQEKLDNMPENLRESSSSGQMLQERYDALESSVSDLDSVDVPEGDTIEEEVRDEHSPEEWEELGEERQKELIAERKSEKVDEIWSQITEAIGNANV